MFSKLQPSPLPPLPQAGEGNCQLPALACSLPHCGEKAGLLPSPACGRGVGGEGNPAINLLMPLLLLIALMLLAACSSDKSSEEDNTSEAQLYQQAQAALDNNSYSAAAEKLRALESRYPFGHFAEQAQLELVYAYYKSGDAEASRSAAERFIRLHPQHPNVDYAWYIKGLTSFEQDRGLLSRFLPLDVTSRDPGAARDSFNEFAELLRRFPQSRYAPDAKQRMVYLRNRLAAYEVHVGNYYIKRKAYLAAANRGRYVVENFQGTPAVGDGLALMVEGYRQLKLDDLADSALATLRLNYPQHPLLSSGKLTTPASDEDYLGAFEQAPPAPANTQANQEVQKQYQNAKDDLPPEIQQ